MIIQNKKLRSAICILLCICMIPLPPSISFASQNSVQAPNNQDLEQLVQDMDYIKSQLLSDLNSSIEKINDTLDKTEEDDDILEIENEYEIQETEMYSLVIEPGKSYEILNSSDISYTLKNTSSSNLRYDFSRLKSNSNYDYGYSYRGSLSLPENSRTIINTVNDGTITFYIPYELYDTVIKIREVENPALYKLTTESGKNYEIVNLSETSNYTLKNANNSSSRYDYSRLKTNGNYDYAYSDWGDLSLLAGSRITLNTVNDASIIFYFPYELYDTAIKIREVENPALHKFTAESGRNYEIVNLSETSNYSLKNANNSSSRYDYSRLRTNGNYDYAYSDWGDLSLLAGSRIILNTVNDASIIFYFPYELYDTAIKIREVENPALHKFTAESGRNYEIVNLSETSNYSLKNANNSSSRYDYSRLRTNGNYDYAYSDWGDLSLLAGSRIILNTVNDASIIFYFPYELYDTAIKIREVENPALYSFTIEPGKNYEIVNLSETSRYTLKNTSGRSMRYDYSRTKADGSYEYGYSDWGDLSLPAGSKAKISAADEEAITFYMPYDLYDTVIKINETSDTSLYRFTIHPGKSYEISNLSDNSYYLKNSSSTARRYDYVRIDTNENYSYDYRDWGSLHLLKNSRILLSPSENESITFYLPYELYGSDIKISEVSDPVLYSFTIEPELTYEITNLSRERNYTLLNTSNSNTRYDYVRENNDGNYKYDYSNWGSLYLPSNSKATINTSSDQAITFWMPYDWKDNVITVNQAQHPSLYKYVLEPGKNYEFTNNSDSNIGIINNSSRSRGTYDYIKYNRNSTITSRYDTYGAIQIDSNKRTLVSVTGDYPIECYIPYNLFISDIEIKEMDESITSIYEVVPRINLQINKVLAKNSNNQANYEVRDNLLNYNIRIHNETKNKKVNGIAVHPDRILLLGENISVGDSLRISISNTLNQTTPSEVVVKIDDSLSAEANVEVIEHGYFISTYNEITKDNRKISVIIFDENLEYVKDFTPKAGKIISEPLPNGTYKVVFIKQAGYMWRLRNLKEYDICGFIEGSDYVLKTIELTDGLIEDLGNINIPSFDEDKISFFDKSETFLTTNSDKILVGGMLEYRLQYEFKEQYFNDSLSNMEINIDIPSGIILVDNSVILDGELVTYSLRNNVLTIPVYNKKGIVKFYVKPFESSKVKTEAEISFSYSNRKVREIIGSTDFDIPYLTIEGDLNTNKTTVKVNGVANKGKDITIFDGNTVVGNAIANNKGQWSAEINLVNPFYGSSHHVYASTFDSTGLERFSNVLDIKYDYSQPTVEELIMYHGNAKINMLEAFSKNSRPQVTFTPSHDFTFEIKVSNSDSIDELYVTSTRSTEQKRIKAVYDKENNRWIARGLFDPNNRNYVPGTISVEYSLKDSEYVADRNETITYDQAINYLPIEWQNADIQVTKETDDKITAKIKLANGKEDEINVTYNTEKLSSPLQHSQYIAQGYTPIKQANGSYAYTKIQHSGESVNFSIVDVVEGTVENILFDVGVDTIGEIVGFVFNETAGNLVGPSVSTISNIISYAGKTIDISEARQTIMNSSISDTEKARLINELDQLQMQVNTVALFNFALTGVTLAASLAGITIPGAFFITCASGLLSSLFDEYYDYKLNSLLTGSRGFSFIWRIDPSGYIYEVTPDNRLEGVTVYAYTQDENGQAILWNAEEYEQVNPLITDVNGRYAWDVPEGMWQVKAELEGYETAYSEWLPVPPPQTEVNIPMISLKAPEVKNINLYTSHAELYFSKYMKVDTVNTQTVDVVNDASISIVESIEPVEAIEIQDGQKLAKKFVINWVEDSPAALGALYNISVDKSVQCYAGIEMTDNSQVLASASIALEKIVLDSSAKIDYKETRLIPVRLEPANAAKDLELICESSMNDIVSVNGISKFDDTGTAYVTVTGNLAGEATLTFRIKDTDFVARMHISVELGSLNIPDEIPSGGHSVFIQVDENTYVGCQLSYLREYLRKMQLTIQDIKYVYLSENIFIDRDGKLIIRENLPFNTIDFWFDEDIKGSFIK